MKQNTAQKKVLIADDDEEIRFLLEEFLAKEGFAVTSAENGAQALEKAKAAPFDLVLLDVAMPVMSGIEALKEIKKIKPEVPVMVITAYRDAEQVVEAYRSGAVDCIFKPFDTEYLRQALRKHGAA